MPTAEEIADANRQFWNLAREIRGREAVDMADPELADLYDDADYLARKAITPRIRERCAAMVGEWRRRGGVLPPSPCGSGDQAPA